MNIIYSYRELQNYLNKKSKLSLGLVPTMGAIHFGHLALVGQSKKENKETVCSIFVNPTQFNNIEDLKKYPRTLEADIKKLEKTQCDILYLPKVEDMYPKGLAFDIIELNGLDKEMEGKYREGHFAGVATIVKKLFLQIKPTYAYFGEKDFQQLQIIKQMVKAEKLNTKIVGVPIVREKNGLAMSSRNSRLTEEQKESALIIYENLLFAKENYKKLSFEKIKENVSKNFKKSNIKLEYFLIVNEEKLTPESKYISGINYRVFIAAFIDEVRLIDNIKLN